ncbi:hypothetical protein BSKO_07178 [Bryopsis sp. KO-2023]|nr:hypothetical protein BSKO_07178 [Bryopsis sp. KO-2023]
MKPAEFSVGCRVCGAAHRPWTCPACVNGGAMSSKKRQLQKLKQSRDELLERLAAKLKQQVVQNQREIERSHQLINLQNFSERASTADEKLKRLRAHIGSLREKNSVRQRRIDDATSSLLEKRREELDVRLPSLYRMEDVVCRAWLSGLKARQEELVRKLVTVMPVSISALRKSTRAPVRVTICDLQLPQKSEDLKAKKEHLGAALGYALKLLELLALYTGGPLLHCSKTQCSSSLIWQPQTFFNREPPPSRAKLPLFVKRQSNRQSTSSRFSDSLTPPHFDHSKDIEEAIKLFHKSIGAFARSKLAPLGDKGLPGWGPIALLVLMANAPDKWLGNTPWQQNTDLGGEGNEGRWKEDPGSPMSNIGSTILCADDDDTSFEDDGWFHVARTLLPPTPAEVEDIRHYEQAMDLVAPHHRIQPQPSSWSFNKVKLWAGLG